MFENGKSFVLTAEEVTALNAAYTNYRARFLVYDDKNKVVYYYTENSALVFTARKGALFTVGEKISNQANKTITIKAINKS